MNGKDRIFLIVVHDQTCDADCKKLQKDMASLGPILAQLEGLRYTCDPLLIG